MYCHTFVWNLTSTKQWGSNSTNNIDGAEAVWVSHNAILVSRKHFATIALLCKQTTDNFRTRHPPEPRWRHLSGNPILFVPHSFVIWTKSDSLHRSWPRTCIASPVTPTAIWRRQIHPNRDGAIYRGTGYYLFLIVILLFQILKMGHSMPNHPKSEKISRVTISDFD